MKYKYGNKLRLLFTVTDNLVYEIKTENVYDVMTTLVRMKKCLILVIILVSQNITMIQTHQ